MALKLNFRQACEDMAATIVIGLILLLFVGFILSPAIEWLKQGTHMSQQERDDREVQPGH